MPLVDRDHQPYLHQPNVIDDSINSLFGVALPQPPQFTIQHSSNKILPTFRIWLQVWIKWISSLDSGSSPLSNALWTLKSLSRFFLCKLMATALFALRVIWVNYSHLVCGFPFPLEVGPTIPPTPRAKFSYLFLLRTNRVLPLDKCNPFLIFLGLLYTHVLPSHTMLAVYPLVHAVIWVILSSSNCWVLFCLLFFLVDSLCLCALVLHTMSALFTTQVSGYSFCETHPILLFYCIFSVSLIHILAHVPLCLLGHDTWFINLI